MARAGIDVVALPGACMTRSIPDGEVRFLGDRAFLIGVANPAAGRDLARALEARVAETGRVEVVCGYATVMVSLTEPDVEPRRGPGRRSAGPCEHARTAPSTAARDRTAS